MSNDKKIEEKRYDERAIEKKKNNLKFVSGDEFLLDFSKDLQQPFLEFKSALLSSLEKDKDVLEIGCGTGAVTNWLVSSGARVIASDISRESISYLRKQFSPHSNLSAVEADMENLPFSNNSFDVVVSAGSLSYGDHNITRDEIYRVLKPKGLFICIDSLNHNPIYRLNRYIHYLNGGRTRSTIERIPNLDLIEGYTNKFGFARVSYFGSVSWLLVILQKLIKNRDFSQFSNWFDNKIRVKKSAFKFVMIAKKI